MGDSQRVRKPEWLEISTGASGHYTETKRIAESHYLYTIYSSGHCSNAGECWGESTVIFIIADDIYTRNCKFYNAQTRCPLPLDSDEPLHIAESVILTELSHAVITSVDRDDLPNLGATYWAQAVREIKRLSPKATTEVLVPDSQERKELVTQVIGAGSKIISYNMGTVKRVSPQVRSAVDYHTGLGVVRQVTESGTTAKSGIMTGLDEAPVEVGELMDSSITVGCKILTVG